MQPLSSVQLSGEQSALHEDERETIRISFTFWPAPLHSVQCVFTQPSQGKSERSRDLTLAWQIFNSNISAAGARAEPEI